MKDGGTGTQLEEFGEELKFGVGPGRCEGSGDFQNVVSLRLRFSHLVLWRNHTWHRKKLRVQQWMWRFQKGQNTGPEVPQLSLPL